MGRLEAMLGVLERYFGDSGPSWTVLGASWGTLVPSWGPPGPEKVTRQTPAAPGRARPRPGAPEKSGVSQNCVSPGALHYVLKARWRFNEREENTTQRVCCFSGFFLTFASIGPAQDAVQMLVVSHVQNRPSQNDPQVSCLDQGRDGACIVTERGRPLSLEGGGGRRRKRRRRRRRRRWKRRTRRWEAEEEEEDGGGSRRR